MTRRAYWLAACLIAALGLWGMSAAMAPQRDGHGRLMFHPGKVETPCPPQDGRTAVIFVSGQSNAANYGEKRQTTAYGDRVVAFFNGACTVAASPLLGADADEGESLTPMADELIRSGRFDRVVLAPVAVGGTEIARWVSGDLAPILRQALDAVQARYEITHAIWHQGENDAANDTSAADYRRSFDLLVAGWRAQGMAAPVFVSVTTRCYPNWTPDNPVALAQRSLPDPERGIYPGADSDALLPAAELRNGACHHNAAGQAHLAKLLAAALFASLPAP